jgi:hypothetical protein
MDNEHRARYGFVCDGEELWKGDRATKGAKCLKVMIYSQAADLKEGPYQVHALTGTGNGIVNGKPSFHWDPKALFDGDFRTLNEAGKKLAEIVAEAKASGFKAISQIEKLEFRRRLTEGEGNAK